MPVFDENDYFNLKEICFKFKDQLNFSEDLQNFWQNLMIIKGLISLELCFDNCFGGKENILKQVSEFLESKLHLK
jgi:hypothetical protein